MMCTFLGSGMTTAFYHHLFTAQSEAAPGRPALQSGDAIVEYCELNERANRLAHHLMSRGIGPESLVGLSVARSPSMIVAILGIAKAGAAYVPVDPAEQSVRRSDIVTNAGLSALIVDHGGKPDDLPIEVEVIDLLRDREAIVAQRDNNPYVPLSERNLAYLLYTSGSSGRPKGIAMEHASVARLIEWHGSARGDALGQRTLQFCSIGFDFSFHEIFSTLCYGGTLVMASDDERLDPYALAQLIASRGIERMFLPVSALLQWAAVVDENSFPHCLRHVFTTGEQLQITPALRMIFGRTRAKLHNHYGATEFQDAATLTLSGDPEMWPAVVPVGHPLTIAAGERA
jgi:non-ribosomal peptide synthetase component F